MKFTDHTGQYLVHCHISEHEDDGMMAQFEVVAPVTATQAVSRKVHGGGGPFDINLPLTGTPGVECRTGGASSDYQLIFTFESAVTFSSAVVATGVGLVSGTSGNGTTTVAVNLTGVSNAQMTTIKLLGVNNGTATGDVSVPMGVPL